jgi:hypothetical protein
LALRGRWARIDEPLFYRRQHAENSTSGRTIHTMATWLDPSARPGRSLPNFRRRLGYLRGVLQAPLPLHERLRCLAVLFRVFARPNELRALFWDSRVLVKELVADLLHPGLRRPAEARRAR